jgi:tRNA(fMet)-specific endonuclease VapC
MDYLLDTNACIALINGNPPLVRVRMNKTLESGARVLVSAIASFELWYGVAKSAKREFNRHRLESFLSGPILVLPFDDSSSRVAGDLRAALEPIGRPIGPYDLLIAGQALHHQLTLVTSNVREFSRVKGLRWADWAKP